jgi:hypothetical protein
MPTYKKENMEEKQQNIEEKQENMEVRINCNVLWK